MSNVQEVSVTLPPELMAMLEDAVKTGEYASTSEAISDALRHWKELRASAAWTAEELRRLWNEGIASGPGRFESIVEIKQEARRRAGAKTIS